VLDCHRLGLGKAIPCLELARHVAEPDDLHRYWHVAAAGIDQALAEVHIRRRRLRRINPGRDRMAVVRHDFEQEIDRKLLHWPF